MPDSASCCGEAAAACGRQPLTEKDAGDDGEQKPGISIELIRVRVKACRSIANATQPAHHAQGRARSSADCAHSR